MASLAMTGLASVAVFLLLFEIRTTSAVNAAFKKHAAANTTCGLNGTERYYGMDQYDLVPYLRVPGFCNNKNRSQSRPPSFLVDGSYNTYWQSKGEEDMAVMEFDFRGSVQKVSPT